MGGFSYPESSLVVAINTESFEDFIKRHERAFIHFGGSWNGVDKMLMPAVVDAAKQLQAKVNFAVFDVDLDEAFCVKHHVLNVPFIEYYVNGRLLESFIGYDPAIALLNRIKNEFSAS